MHLQRSWPDLYRICIEAFDLLARLRAVGIYLLDEGGRGRTYCLYSSKKDAVV